MKVTEKWIKEKIQFGGENLEDIKSLALPGSYKDKISYLGTSLVHFSRLKELDLSRNALVSLDGIEHLQHLEVLNLYFNQIGSLEEVYKLRSNSKLIELDVRLNPLGRNEPDYRLYLVHMLTGLRKLDDRAIQNDERRAAVMNFSSDTAREFSRPTDTQLHRMVISNEEPDPPTLFEADPTPLPSQHPRVAHIDKWGGQLRRQPTTPQIVCTDFDDKDKAVANNSMASGSTTQPPPGSDRTWNHRQDPLQRPVKALTYRDVDEHLQIERETNSHLSMDQSASNIPEGRGSSNKIQKVAFSFHQRSVVNGGHFDENTSKAVESFTNNVENGGKEEDGPAKACISQLCDLVDRYWNGRKSLHSHQKFLPAAVTLLRNLMQQPQSATYSPQRPIDRKPPLSGSRQTNREVVDELQNKLNELKLENQKLLEEIRKQDRKDPAVSKPAHLGDEAHREMENMRQEVTAMRVKLRALEQMADMAQMLKESHKSLVATNRQLMLELKEARIDQTKGAARSHHPDAMYNAQMDYHYDNKAHHGIESPRGFATFEGKIHTAQD